MAAQAKVFCYDKQGGNLKRKILRFAQNDKKYVIIPINAEYLIWGITAIYS